VKAAILFYLHKHSDCWIKTLASLRNLHNQRINN
jgi:hypothetical protein